MQLLVRAFPLIRPLDEVQEFLDALSGARREETARFYREFGVVHESAHLQMTEQRPILIAVTILESAHEAGPRYGAASQEFHTWFKAQIQRLTGIDPNEMPLGPPTTELFHWHGDEAGAPAPIPRLTSAT